MATGLLTLACLLVAAGAAPPDPCPINQRAVSVPIKIDPTRRDEIKELVLYSSNDHGKTWTQAAVATPDKDAFPFIAPTDGVYWLSLVVVDRKGGRDPADVYRSPPAMKLLVDTVKPVLRITAAERQGDEVVVGWEIQEEHPDLASLKLEYRGGNASGQWASAPLIPAPTGQTRFRSPGPGSVMLRLQLKDLAENFSVTTSEIPAAQAPPPPAPVVAAPAPAPTPSFGMAANPPTVPAYTPAAGATPTRPAPMAGAWETATTAFPAPVTPRPADTPYSPVPPPRYQPTPYPERNVLASSENNIAPVGYFNSQAGSRQPRGREVPRKIIRTLDVSLDYEVKNDGPSGIGRVELWLTSDDGQTWRKYRDEQNPGLSLGSKHRSLTADLPGEGTYGLSLVVLSKAGLGKRPPQPNDPPDVRVEVDLTKPVAVLNEPEPDPQNPNAIILSWSASDKNPAPNPVRLDWKDPAGSDWKTIQDNLPLNGQHSWRLPSGMPSWVHLRVVARDAVGNEATAETKEPVLVDLSRPEGHIVGIGTGRDH